MGDELMAGAAAIERLQRSLERTSLRDLVRARKQKRSLLLVDVSISMDEPVKEGQRKIDVLRHVVRELLKTHEVPVAAFGLSGPEPVALITGEIPEPSGGTPMHLAIAYAKELGAEHIVLVTDGQPDSTALAIAAAQDFGGRIDAYYAGPAQAHGATFLKQMAELTGGECGVTDLGDPKQLTAGIAGYLNA